MTVKATAALLALTVAATTAGAQAAGARGQRQTAAAPQQNAPKCDIQSGGSAPVMAGYEALARFNGESNESEKPKHLAAAVKQVSSPLEKPDAELARQWVLGQALVAWTLIPSHPTVGTRASFGYTTDPQGSIDILYAADTLFDAIEAKVPDCAESIDTMRRLPYVTTANKAVELFNAGNTDSAAVLGERAMRIYPNGAPTYHLLGNIAVKKQDYPKAIELLSRAAELAAGDTSLKDIRVGSLQSAALLLSNQAQTAEGAERQALASKAAGFYRELIQLQPENAEMQTGLAQVLALTGDSTALGGIYAGMLAQPDQYTSFQLLDAGVGAINAGRSQDAVSLVELAVQRNPYYRDGLFALTYAYSATQQYDKMRSAVQRLIEVDPSNPDNYNLLRDAYTGTISTLSDTKAKKAYTDSLVRASTNAQKMPVRVSFGDFQQPAAGQRVLNGKVENLGSAAASYTIKFEFLDAAGNVVMTKDETVADVGPQQSKTFAVSAEGQNIVAFRYAPLAP